MRIVVEALAARAAADPDVSYHSCVFYSQGPSVFPTVLNGPCLTHVAVELLVGHLGADGLRRDRVDGTD